MTTQEIKTAGFRLFEATAVAMMNVSNGCYSDQKIIDTNMPRLVKMVSWFEENDLMKDFEYFVTSGKFNRSELHFFTNKLLWEITNK